MRFTMSQQTATISFTIIFFLAFGLYFRFFVTEKPEVPEPTVITEVSNEKESLPEFTGDAPEVISEKDEGDVTVQEPAATATPPPVFDSFNEDALGKEFDNIQTGIDLLNNPLR